MSEEPLWPNVVVQLSGQDGNGFVIACRARSALRRAGLPEETCELFWEQALSGNYDHLLQTVMEWVTVE